MAAHDVARVVAEILRNPERHREHVYELTGPEVLGIDGLARSFSEGLQQPVAGVDIAYDDWVENVLKPIGLPSHVEQHIATMARLHREGRYDRLTDDVERVTGRPAVTVAQYVAEHRERFGG